MPSFQRSTVLRPGRYLPPRFARKIPNSKFKAMARLSMPILPSIFHLHSDRCQSLRLRHRPEVDCWVWGTRWSRQPSCCGENRCPSWHRRTKWRRNKEWRNNKSKRMRKRCCWRSKAETIRVFFVLAFFFRPRPSTDDREGQSVMLTTQHATIIIEPCPQPSHHMIEILPSSVLILVPQQQCRHT